MNFYSLLRLHKRIKSRRLKLLGLFAASHLRLRHLSIRIDPVLGCNLACRMCNYSSPEHRRSHKGTLATEEFEEIARVLFPRAFQLIVGCGAEPTKHPQFKELFWLAKQYKVPDVGIVSNGQLLKKSDLEYMAEQGVNEIILSAHGVTQGTYEKFMTGASYEKFLELLEQLTQLKEKLPEKNVMSVRINYTVNPDNLEELERFFEVLGDYQIDALQVRPIMDIGGKYTKLLTEELRPRYNQIIKLLSIECDNRGVKLLANTLDLSYQKENEDADLAELVYTYVSPNTAPQLNISWANCSFSKFRRADHWNRRLWKAFFSKKSGGKWLSRSLKYEEV
ncbi:radical SAM protein [Marinilabilia salmonicolor]|uniref:radical SAM protein n=1 Tax=Marinilabilia salmonicolor TaxID=989 RepID=UPI00029A34BD|nr:radical SAM protein [Marinilabilia salmonicolor]